MDPAPLAVVSPRMETLLHALTVERSRVRRATESLQNAYETISTLEAQLARREAELESRDHQCITDVKPVPNRSSSFGSVHPNFLEVPISEIVHLSSIAEEQNYILEQEVSELSDRVSSSLSRNSLSKSIIGAIAAEEYASPTFYFGCGPNLTCGIRDPTFPALFTAGDSGADRALPERRRELHRAESSH